MRWTRRSLLASGAALLASRRLYASQPTVLVLLSDREPATLATAESFKGAAGDCARITFDLTDEPDAAAYIADNIQGLDIAAVFAVGQKAAVSAAREFSTTPLVVAGADTDTLKRPNVRRVSTRVDPGATLDRLAAALPRLRAVGVLGTEDEAWLAALARAGEERAIQLRALNLSSAAEIHNAWQTLAPPSDLVWLLPGPVWSGGALASLFHEASIVRRPVLTFDRAHFSAEQPPPLAALPGPAGLGATAGGLVAAILARGPDAVAPEVYAPPWLVGCVVGLRAAGLPMGRGVMSALDEVIR